MGNGLCIQIGLDDTDRTFVASGVVLLLDVLQFDKNGDRAIHGAQRIGIARYRFRHDALKRGRKALQQKNQGTVKQHAAFGFGDGEIQSHVRLENSDPTHHGV